MGGKEKELGVLALVDIQGVCAYTKKTYCNKPSALLGDKNSVVDYRQ